MWKFIVVTLLVVGCGNRAADMHDAGIPPDDSSDAAAPSSTKDLTTFALTSAANSSLPADVHGSIVGSQISLQVPFGTDRTHLVPSFTTTGVSVRVGDVEQTSGVTMQDMTSPVVYRVGAEDGSEHDYTVTVTEAASTAKEITAFSFRAADNPALTGDVTATITGLQISATVPFGTPVSALVASFTTTGAAVRVGTTTQVSGTTANDFASPVTYHIVADDTSSQDYVVTVVVAPSSAKDLTSFVLRLANNPPIVTDQTGQISGTSIAVTVPSAVPVTSLIATFATTGTSVTVGGVAQTSGVSTVDYTQPVAFVVHAADGTTKTYSVTVALAPASAKALTAFGWRAAQNPALDHDVTAKIAGTAIDATVPFATDVAALIPTFSTTGQRVDVAGVTQITSVTAQDFSRPVAYRVHAADGTTTTFTVTVHVEAYAYQTRPPTAFQTGFGALTTQAADLNADGKPDLVVMDSSVGRIAVGIDTTAPGDGSASFTDPTFVGTTETPRAFAIEDFNTDGSPDVVVVGDTFTGDIASVFLNTTPASAVAPTFAAASDFSVGTMRPVAVRAGDVNGDGRPDLVIAVNDAGFAPTTGALAVLLNTTPAGATTATFAGHVDFQTGGAPTDVALADVDRDGKLDIAVLNYASDVAVFRNTAPAGAGAPQLASPTPISRIAGTTSQAIAAADLNDDGKPEIVVTDFGAFSVFRNDTAGTTIAFAAEQSFPLVGNGGVAIADMNGDRAPDVVGIGSLALNHTPRAASTFAFARDRMIDAQSSGSGPPALADFDGDHRPDFAAIHGPGAIVVPTADPAFVFLASVNPSLREDVVATGTGTTLSATVPFGVDPSVLIPTFTPTWRDVTVAGVPQASSVTPQNFTTSKTYATTIAGAGHTFTVTVAVAPRFFSQRDLTTTFQDDAVACGDINGDGKVDLVSAGRSSDRVATVYMNVSTAGAQVPSFAQRQVIPADFANQLLLVDVNGDNKKDLVIDGGTSVTVMLDKTAVGAAVATFGTPASFSVSAGANGTTISFADLNRDGKPDLLVPSADGFAALLNQTATNGTTPSFTTVDVTVDGGATIVSALATGDINGDGTQDVVVAGFTEVTVVLNTTAAGAPSLTFASGSDIFVENRVRGVVVADLDRDGVPDVVVSADGQLDIAMNRTSQGSQTVAFAAMSTIASGFDGVLGLVAADFDGDGVLDLAGGAPGANTAAPDAALIFANTTAIGSDTPALTMRTAQLFPDEMPSAACSADLNADGRPDLALIGQVGARISVLASE